MGVIANAVRELIALGIEGEALIAAIARIEEGASGPRKERSSGAERQARYRQREAEAQEKRNGDVTRDVTVEASRCDVTSVTNRNEVTPPSCARLEINPLDRGLSAAAAEHASADSDNWPEGGLLAWRDALVMLAGPGLADPAKTPGLITTVAEIDRWRLMGCSWGQDVVPTIQGRTLKPRPNNQIGSWNLFTRDVLATKARRQAQVEAPNVVQLQATGPPSNAAAAMREEGRRRALARYEADG